ncbi:MAG TPA: hypothetical protein VJB12_01230 [Candidatus Nanoarchaeia archaeon]|nr:hypothetical protein [Candidatus Nanoarchaeia archaeon]
MTPPPDQDKSAVSTQNQGSNDLPLTERMSLSEAERQILERGQLSDAQTDIAYHRIELTSDQKLLCYGNKVGTGQSPNYMLLEPHEVAIYLRFKPTDYVAIGGGKPISEKKIFEILAETSNMGTIRGIRAMKYPDAVQAVTAIVQSYHK